jgi:rubrerythrin
MKEKIKKAIDRREKEHQEMVKKLNELSRKNPGPLIQWLIDAEQIPESEEDYLKVVNLIKKHKQEILNKLLKDRVSFELYDKIREGFEKGNIVENKAFQKTYKRFYKLGRNFGDKLSKKYFELLQKKEKNLEKVLAELSKVPGSNNRFLVWLCFASKLIHTVDNNKPIYDSMVAEAFYIRMKYIKDINKRIKDRLEIYNFLEQRVREILDDQEIATMVKDFKEKLGSDISDVKMLDFILWKLGGILIKQSLKN